MATMLQSFGNKLAPAIVCVPGLLGGAEDFRDTIARFGESHHLLVFDPNAERREMGINGLTLEVMQEIKFDCNADELAQEIKKYTHEPAWMCGISIGGKIVYDFAIKFPQLFRGAVITDVGLGSFSESELYCFVEDIVDNINLNQSWPELKKDLRAKIADDSLRSLIQSQVFYPTKQPPAAWKIGMANFKGMLNRQSTDDQFESYQGVDGILADKGSLIHIMKATQLSAINERSFEKLNTLKSIKIHSVRDSSHFLQFTHKEILLDLIDQMAKK
jgi:pimeloyl-ACP methyl ester carboxylesterase